MQKKVLFAGAMLGALLSAGAANAAGGYIGLSYQDRDDDVSATAVSGAVAVNANLQIDGRYASLDVYGDDGSDSSIGAHLFQRGETWLWGGYVGFSNYDSGPYNFDEKTFAFETQYYMPRTTFTGVVGYTDADELAQFEQWAADVEVRHFIGDNFSVQANAGYAWVDVNNGAADTNGVSYGIGAEYQFDAVPLSIYAGWQHADFDLFSTENDAYGVGVRWNFGSDSLLARNRSGAGLSHPLGFMDRFSAEFSPR